MMEQNKRSSDSERQQAPNFSLLFLEALLLFIGGFEINDLRAFKLSRRTTITSMSLLCVIALGTMIYMHMSATAEDVGQSAIPQPTQIAMEDSTTPEVASSGEVAAIDSELVSTEEHLGLQTIEPVSPTDSEEVFQEVVSSMLSIAENNFTRILGNWYGTYHNQEGRIHGLDIQFFMESGSLRARLEYRQGPDSGATTRFPIYVVDVLYNPTRNVLEVSHLSAVYLPPGWFEGVVSLDIVLSPDGQYLSGLFQDSGDTFILSHTRPVFATPIPAPVEVAPAPAQPPATPAPTPTPAPEPTPPPAAPTGDWDTPLVTPPSEVPQGDWDNWESGEGNDAPQGDW